MVFVGWGHEAGMTSGCLGSSEYDRLGKHWKSEALHSLWDSLICCLFLWQGESQRSPFPEVFKLLFSRLKKKIFSKIHHLPNVWWPEGIIVFKGNKWRRGRYDAIANSRALGPDCLGMTFDLLWLLLGPWESSLTSLLSVPQVSSLYKKEDGNHHTYIIDSFWELNGCCQYIFTSVMCIHIHMCTYTWHVNKRYIAM